MGKNGFHFHIQQEKSHKNIENLFSGNFFAGQCYQQKLGHPANDNKGYQVLNFINKNKLNILNDGRHKRASDTSKSAIDLTIMSPSLQPILSWNVTASPSSRDHSGITVNVQSENSEPQTTITKLNIKKETGISLLHMKLGRKSQIQIHNNLLKLYPKI